MPTVNIPVFNRRTLITNRDVTEANAREAEINWRRTVLSAVEEVQSALTLCLNWRRQLTAYERASKEAARVLELSRESYRGGVSTLTDILDAERQVASNRLAVADAIRNHTLSWLEVQISTGQGWLTSPDATGGETMRPQMRSDHLGVAAALR